jgi:hypothetical protein
MISHRCRHNDISAAAALRKLLEAKDAAIRAKLYKET